MEHVDTMVHHTELSGDQLIARLDQSVLHVNETASRLSELHADYYWNTSNWLTSYLGSTLSSLLWRWKGPNDEIMKLFVDFPPLSVICSGLFFFSKLALC